MDKNNDEDDKIIKFPLSPDQKKDLFAQESMDAFERAKEKGLNMFAYIPYYMGDEDPEAFAKEYWAGVDKFIEDTRKVDESDYDKPLTKFSTNIPTSESEGDGPGIDPDNKG